MAAAWLTVNETPPIVTVPLRVWGVEFAAALNATVPFPLPLAPLVTVIHEALLVAVHAHPAPAVTVVDPVPPPTATDWLVGESEYEQAPPWFTVYVIPATVSVPMRGDVDGLASTTYVRLPLPFPNCVPENESHPTLLIADHTQPLGAVTFTLPVVVLPPTEVLVGDNE